MDGESCIVGHHGQGYELVELEVLVESNTSVDGGLQYSHGHVAKYWALNAHRKIP